MKLPGPRANGLSGQPDFSGWNSGQPEIAARKIGLQFRAKKSGWKTRARVCVMIEFSSKGVQTMFLAYIGGLFWIQSENENKSTSHKKFKKYIKVFFYRFGPFFIFPRFIRIFCDLYSHFHFLTEFKKVRQYMQKTLFGPLLKRILS